MKKLLTGLLLMSFILSAVLTGCTTADDETVTVRITHKDYTEQRLTGQLMSVHLENRGFDTTVTELGGTMLVWNALDTGEVDLYAEFTGTAYGAIFDQTDIIGVQETYEYVKSRSEEEHGITWLEPLGWNNTYVLSVRAETQEEYNLTTIEDLIAVSSELVLGTDTEFQNRADGLPGLQEYYPGLEFKNIASMDQGLTYGALNSGDIDVNVSYSTDGRIAKFGLINLEDNENFFPPYYVTPILKIDFADEHPEVVEALNELGGNWTDEDMQNYNLMVDEGADARVVATDMLAEAGLID